MVFETAPFKFTKEYVELLGGIGSEMYNYFVVAMIRGFMSLQNNTDEICYILKIMRENSDLPCFSTFDMEVFIDRFKPKLEYN